mgnify:CR=1 FL=1
MANSGEYERVIMVIATILLGALLELSAYLMNICIYLYIYLHLGVDRMKTFAIIEPTPTKEEK